MEETKTLKSQNFVGYQLDNGVYSLVDFKTGEILNTMNEVSILFDGDVLLKHGHPDKINWRSKHLRKMYSEFGIESDIHIITGKIPVDELDKILTIVGYMPKEITDCSSLKKENV